MCGACVHFLLSSRTGENGPGASFQTIFSKTDVSKIVLEVCGEAESVRLCRFCCLWRLYRGFFGPLSKNNIIKKRLLFFLGGGQENVDLWICEQALSIHGWHDFGRTPRRRERPEMIKPSTLKTAEHIKKALHFTGKPPQNIGCTLRVR